jgi:hypothetical protein
MALAAAVVAVAGRVALASLAAPEARMPVTTTASASSAHATRLRRDL